MPKRGHHRMAHRADTCHRAIRKECRYALVKRHQYDAAVAMFRIDRGRMPFLKEAVFYAMRLYMSHERIDSEFARPWGREKKLRIERLRSRGFVRRTSLTPYGRAIVHVKVRRSK